MLKCAVSTFPRHEGNTRALQDLFPLAPSWLVLLLLCESQVYSALRDPQEKPQMLFREWEMFPVTYLWR